MNTTPTRMAYDRRTRQQQLSIAIAHTKEDVVADRRIAGKKTAPPVSGRTIKLIISPMPSIVVLFTSGGSRRLV